MSNGDPFYVVSRGDNESPLPASWRNLKRKRSHEDSTPEVKQHSIMTSICVTSRKRPSFPANDPVTQKISREKISQLHQGTDGEREMAKFAEMVLRPGSNSQGPEGWVSNSYLRLNFPFHFQLRGWTAHSTWKTMKAAEFGLPELFFRAVDKTTALVGEDEDLDHLFADVKDVQPSSPTRRIKEEDEDLDHLVADVKQVQPFSSTGKIKEEHVASPAPDGLPTQEVGAEDKVAVKVEEPLPKLYATQTDRATPTQKKPVASAMLPRNETVRLLFGRPSEPVEWPSSKGADIKPRLQVPASATPLAVSPAGGVSSAAVSASAPIVRSASGTPSVAVGASNEQEEEDSHVPSRASMERRAREYLGTTLIWEQPDPSEQRRDNATPGPPAEEKPHPPPTPASAPAPAPAVAAAAAAAAAASAPHQTAVPGPGNADAAPGNRGPDPRPIAQARLNGMALRHTFTLTSLVHILRAHPDLPRHAAFHDHVRALYRAPDRDLPFAAYELAAFAAARGAVAPDAVTAIFRLAAVYMRPGDSVALMREVGAEIRARDLGALRLRLERALRRAASFVLGNAHRRVALEVQAQRQRQSAAVRRAREEFQGVSQPERQSEE